MPPAQLGEYKGVEVGRREPVASADEVQTELDRLRESLASLETVEREAADGDFVVMDFVGHGRRRGVRGRRRPRPRRRARLPAG